MGVPKEKLEIESSGHSLALALSPAPCAVGPLPSGNNSLEAFTRKQLSFLAVHFVNTFHF